MLINLKLRHSLYDKAVVLSDLHYVNLVLRFNLTIFFRPASITQYVNTALMPAFHEQISTSGNCIAMGWGGTRGKTAAVT